MLAELPSEFLLVVVEFVEVPALQAILVGLGLRRLSRTFDALLTSEVCWRTLYLNRWEEAPDPYLGLDALRASASFQASPTLLAAVPYRELYRLRHRGAQ